MSQSSLNWQFHDDDEADLLPEPPPRPRRQLSWGKVLAWLGLGALVLALAGIGGFAFGRYQRSTTAARADLQAALDIETWAWQSGNRQLFLSNLDLAARPDWRRDLERQFETSGRDIRSVSLRSFRFVKDDVVQAEVDVLGAHGVQREQRYYRLINGQWRRTSSA